MAYTNIWNESKLTGAEAANTIATLINAVRVDVQDRLQDIFQTPDFTVDPLRLYGLKFTDAQDAVLNLGDNAGTPRNLTIKNKAASSTYYTFSSIGLIIAPTSALGLQINTLINNTAGMQLHQAGVQDWSIGNAATTGNFVINNGSVFAGTNYLTLTPNGAFQFAGSLQITVNLAAPVGGFGKSASQGFVISGVTGSTNDLLLTNGLGGSVLSIPTGTQNAVFANSLTVSAGLTVTNGLTVSNSGINVNGGILVNNGGLTISAGTTTVQGLGASSISITGILSSGGQIQGNVSGGDINSAFLASSATPAYAWKATGGAANEKVWDAVVSGSSLFFRTALDAGGGNVNWLQVTRSGTTISNVIVPNGGFVVNTDPGGADTIRSTGSLRLANTGGSFIITKVSSAPLDSKQWWWQILNADGTFRLRAVNDAESNGFNAFICTRTGITPLILTLMPDGGSVTSTGALTVNNSLIANQGIFTAAITNRASALTTSFADVAGHGRITAYGANPATIGVLDLYVLSSDGSAGWSVTFAASGIVTVPNGFTVAGGGMGVTGTSALQAVTCTTINTSSTATVNSLLSVGAITTNQNDLTFIGGAVDTLFKNAANNITNLSIADNGSVTIRNGLTISASGLTATGQTLAASISNMSTGFQIGSAAATGNFLRGNGTNFVASTIQVSDLPTLDSVRAYKSAASQTLSQNTLTAISFDAEDYDTNTMHDNVTNNTRLTAQSSGKYKITAHIGWTGVASNVFIIIRKNGVATNLAETFLTLTNTSIGTTEVNCTLSLAANDYVEIYGQGDNVTPTILNNQERTYFEMQKLTA